MKVCFVYPDIEGTERYGAKKFYQGIGYLSSVLKKAGHVTSLIYLQSEIPRTAFLDEIHNASPGLVAFSATTNQFPFVSRFAAFIKQETPSVPVICGGAHATLAPERVIEDEAVDMLCVGEGEFALLELVDRLERGDDVTNIRNLWFKRDGQVIRNPSRPLIQDFDELPFPDRELFGFHDILKANGGWVDVMAGRGCPYECSYCCNPSLKRTFHGLGKYVRFRGVENLLAEIRQLTADYQVRVLNFQDDVFTLNRSWTREFCDAYARSFSIPFWVNTRVERVLDEDVVESLAKAGCQGVRIGIESGSETLRREILKRSMSNATILQAFRLLRKHGLQTYTCNMIGIPGETPRMMQETVDFNRQLSPDAFQFSVFYPYPMTQLHDICVENGYYQDGEYLSSYYSSSSLLKMPELSQDDISRGYDRFVDLQWELDLKKRNPLKHRLYTLLRLLYGNDTPRLRAHLRSLANARRLVTRKGQHAAVRRTT